MSLWEADGGGTAFDPLAELTARRQQRRRRRRAGLVGSLSATALAAGLLASGSTGGINALFTDSAPVGNNAFATGSLDISASPASSAIPVTRSATVSRRSRSSGAISSTALSRGRTISPGSFQFMGGASGKPAWLK